MIKGRNRQGASTSDLRKLHNQMPKWVVVLLITGIMAIVVFHIAYLIGVLIIAAIIAYILNSAVNVLERVGIKRSLAVIFLFVAAGASVVFADLIFVPDLKQEIMNAYERFPAFSRQIEGALLTSARSAPMIESGVRRLVEGIFGPTGLIEKTLSVSEIITQATPFVMGLVLVPFFVFFLLKDWPGVLRKVMDWVPASYVETTVSVIAEINILVGRYLRGLAADCFFIGVLASFGLWLIGINYPIILGILSGVANIVPYLGPITSCSLACIVALTQFNSFEPVLNVVIVYISIRLVDDLLIQPLIIGKSVKLHPMLLVITIITGEKLFGISGMVLGVPIVTAAQKIAGILLEHHRERAKREAAEALMECRVEETPIMPI